MSRVTAGALEAVAEPIRRTTRSAAKVARDATRIDGRTSRWTQHRATRREELLDAAIAAINEHGTDVGMDQIAAAANTSKPVIYRYFEDKNALYRAIGERVTRRIVAAVRPADDDADPRAMLHASIDSYLQLLDQNPQLFRFVTENRLLYEPESGSEFSGDIAAALTSVLGEQLRACGLDPGAAAPWGEAIVGFIRAASLWWLNHPGAMTRVQLTDYLVALLWGGAAGVYQSAGHPVDARPASGVFPALT